MNTGRRGPESEAAKAAVLLVTDLVPGSAAWEQACRQAEAVKHGCKAVLGFAPAVRVACLPEAGEAGGDWDVPQVLAVSAEQGAAEMFVLPASLDFDLWQRERLGQVLAEWRRNHPAKPVWHDEVDVGHPLVVDTFAEELSRAMAWQRTAPPQSGLLLISDGDGDSGTRSHSYRLMRQLWEQLSLKTADVAFVRHAQPFLGAALERCAQESLQWFLLPQAQWASTHFEYAATILENHQRTNPGAAGWQLIAPPGAHPALTAWYVQRFVRLWQERQRRNAIRLPSSRRQPVDGCRIWSGAEWSSPEEARGRIADGALATVERSADLATMLGWLMPDCPAVLIKVTWHGYAQGTYTDPAALDLLLEALPGRAIVLEGHTSSRCELQDSWDWETEAQQHRAWIRRQESDYLRRTGLADVLARHRASYVNVTEEWWDERCAPAAEIEQRLRENGVQLVHPELSGFVPAALMEHAGAPMISFAKFKGATRLGISNLFGLLPPPLRSAWHGPNITYFANVCCDLALLYGALFPLYGINEALYSAVRWDRQGLYRSRWGNYDLLQSQGLVTLSKGLPAADVLASRIQGKNVEASGFFDVVRSRLGWPASAAAMPLPAEVQMKFA